LCFFVLEELNVRNDLFFKCSFCKRVWLGKLRKCLVADLLYEWDAIAEKGVKYCKGKGLQASCFIPSSIN
jgi:hypothetical protein